MSLNDLDFNAEHDLDLVALISDKTPRWDAGMAELQEKLNEAMLKLSEHHRLVVTLHDVQRVCRMKRLGKSWIATSQLFVRACSTRVSSCRLI